MKTNNNIKRPNFINIMQKNKLTGNDEEFDGDLYPKFV